jgi:hypothetical protein
VIIRFLEIARAALAEAGQRPRRWVQWARRREGEPRHGVLHQEECWSLGRPDLTAEHVRALLAAHGERITRCDICRHSRGHDETPPHAGRSQRTGGPGGP